MNLVRHVTFGAFIGFVGAFIGSVGVPPATAGAAVQPSPASADTDDAAPVTWGIVPSGPDGPGERAAFEYALDPGSVIDDIVAVSNYTEEPLTLAIYASDAVRNTSGGFDLLTAGDEPTDVGSWVDLGEPTITIPARSRVDVPFRITVPDDATPGDHAGGIVASMTTPAARDTRGDVTVDRRVGTRIYLRVSGTLDPVLTVEDVHTSFAGLPFGQPGTVNVEYTVHNEGNVRLAGRPAIRVAGPFGLGERHWTGAALPELLPGDSISGTATVRDVWQLGRLTIDIDVRPESSGDQALDPPPDSGTASARLWVVPWVTLAVLAAVVAFIVWHRRRRRRHSVTPTPA